MCEMYLNWKFFIESITMVSNYQSNVLPVHKTFINFDLTARKVRKTDRSIFL